MGGSGGGGSSSGKISYPEYMQSTHSRMLFGQDEEDHATMGTWDFNVMDDIETAHYNNPYDEAFFYDPSTELGEISTVVGELSTIVGNLDPDTDWEGYVDRAKTKVEAALLDDDTYIENKVEAFDEDTKAEFLRGVARLKAGFADINAVQSSGYVFALMGMEKQRLRQVSNHRAELQLRSYKERLNLIYTGVESISRNYVQQAQLKAAEIESVLKDSQLSIAANSDYVSGELEISSNAAAWDLETWQYGVNVLAGVSGGTTGAGPQMKGKSTAQRIGGGLAGATAAATAAGAAATGPFAPLIISGAAIAGGAGGALA